MTEIAYNILNNSLLLRIGAYLGVPITIILLVLFALKRNRDERGWKIIGKASIITFIYFIIVANLIAKVVGNMALTFDLNYLCYANTIQWLYNTTIMLEILAILILKRIE